MSSDTSPKRSREASALKLNQLVRSAAGFYRLQDLYTEVYRILTPPSLPFLFFPFLLSSCRRRVVIGVQSERDVRD